MNIPSANAEHDPCARQTDAYLKAAAMEREARDRLAARDLKPGEETAVFDRGQDYANFVKAREDRTEKQKAWEKCRDDRGLPISPLPTESRPIP